MKGKHQKHPPLKRPLMGQYHRLEWAVYGTTCSEIESFYNTLDNHFIDKYRLTYIDADHSDTYHGRAIQIGKKQYAQNHVFSANSFDDKFNIALSQAVFVNGNHFKGQRQIVIINPEKKDSLQRRVEQLDRIDFVVLPKGQTEIFDFVKAKMSTQTAIFNQSEMVKIFEFIEREIKNNIPSIKALILAGGKSARMQEDKSQLKYHEGLTQEVYLANICQSAGLETFISKSSDNAQSVISGFPVIKDRYLDMGPFGAILSAFMHDPDAAWMVLACDLPYLSKEVILKLIDGRSVLHMGTAFKLEDSPFPEPLMAIYEPSIYKRMLGFLSLGYACPRKVLINSEVKHIMLEDKKIAFNANTPQDRQVVLDQLKNKI